MISAALCTLLSLACPEPPAVSHSVGVAPFEPRYQLRAIYTTDLTGVIFDSKQDCENSAGKKFVEQELADIPDFEKRVECEPVGE